MALFPIAFQSLKTPSLPVRASPTESTRRLRNERIQTANLSSSPDTADKPAEEESIPQTDGSGVAGGGSDLHEPEYSVEVKLTDLQADPNNPLYSVKSFGDLGM